MGIIKKYIMKVRSKMKKTVILLNQATYKTLVLRTYTLPSDKLSEPFRIVQISDLHCCYYGENQSELIEMIEAQHPDLIVMTGDIIDSRQPHKNSMIVAEAVGKKYPVYYVSGNNEFETRQCDRIKQNLRDVQIKVLDGCGEKVTVGGQSIFIGGIDDFIFGTKVCEEQLKNAAKDLDPTVFSILLSHRPEQINRYRNYDFDLVFSGHAHGGQWRIPGLINGVFAPNQGFFPKYAGGIYHFRTKHSSDPTHRMSMIVSRGLANETTLIPRLFNQPELVVVDVVKR